MNKKMLIAFFMIFIAVKAYLFTYLLGLIKLR